MTNTPVGEQALESLWMVQRLAPKRKLDSGAFEVATKSSLVTWRTTHRSWSLLNLKMDLQTAHILKKYWMVRSRFPSQPDLSDESFYWRIFLLFDLPDKSVPPAVQTDGWPNVDDFKACICWRLSSYLCLSPKWPILPNNECSHILEIKFICV